MLSFIKRRKIKTKLKLSQEKYKESYSECDAWKIYDRIDFVTIFSMKLRKKCKKSNVLESLKFEEKVVCLNYSFANEICNYGLIEYLYGKHANYYNELVLSLHEVGAYELEDLLKATVELLRGEIPIEQEKRKRILDKIINEHTNTLLNEIEKTMFIYLEDLFYQIYEYVKDNKIKFI